MPVGAANTIQELVEAMVDSWNRRDWASFGRLFAHDAQYFTSAGVRLAGRDQICRELATLAETPHSSGHVSMVADSVTLFRPDIAVVWCRWRMGSDSRAGLLTMVMQREDARWQIVVLRNTDEQA